MGYSPYNGPSFNPIGPFDELFTGSRNLVYAENLDGVDALVLWGGSDISPSLYGEHPYTFSGPLEPSERDMFEWELIRQAVAKGIPIIGICRGGQMLCAAAGGKLVQHVNGHECGHHNIIVNNNGVNTEFSVTSSHHQMMYPYDVEHELLGWMEEPRSNDYEPNYKLYCAEMEKGHHKEAEVVYFPQIKGLAIQCHPEWHTKKDHPFNMWMLKYLRDNVFKETV